MSYGLMHHRRRVVNSIDINASSSSNFRCNVIIKFTKPREAAQRSVISYLIRT